MTGSVVVIARDADLRKLLSLIISDRGALVRSAGSLDDLDDFDTAPRIVVVHTLPDDVPAVQDLAKRSSVIVLLSSFTEMTADELGVCAVLPTPFDVADLEAALDRSLAGNDVELDTVQQRVVRDRSGVSCALAE